MNRLRYILPLLLLVLSPALALAHHTKEASIIFENENGVLKVTVSVEELNLINAIKLEEGCDPTRSLGICANWYIRNHLKIAINGRAAELDFIGSKTVEDQAKVSFTINHFVQNIRSISINNDCFLDLMPDFSSSIRFLFTDYERGYIMDRKRMEITARF